MTAESLHQSTESTAFSGRNAVKAPAMVECLHLHKAFQPSPSLFRDVSLRIAPGEFVALTGPGGGGKTTFLRLLFGLEPPDSGIVLVDGRNVHALSPREVAVFRQRVGMVFQDLKLMPGRTVYENVALPLFALGKREAVTRQKVTQMLAALRLQDKASVDSDKLAESERQRIAIARAMVHDPLLILADEPDAHLDEPDSVLVAQLFERARMCGATVLVTAHESSSAVARTATRTLEIHEGRIIERRSGAG